MTFLISRRDRPGPAASLAIAWIGLAGWFATASAQSSFDPYRPESSRYDSSSFPTVPNNLALPNAAREASEYALPRGPGSSPYNSFERYLSEGAEGDLLSSSSARPRGPNIGVPYYDAYRRYDRELQRDYVPNRETDRTYYADLARREKLYQDALKERDPARRAQLLRDYHQGVRSRTAQAPARSTAATRGNAPAARNNTGESLAADALNGARAPVLPGGTSASMLDPMSTPSTRPSGAVGTRGILERQRRETEMLRRRPPLPVESAPARRATAPAPAPTGDRPAPGSNPAPR